MLSTACRDQVSKVLFTKDDYIKYHRYVYHSVNVIKNEITFFRLLNNEPFERCSQTVKKSLGNIPVGAVGQADPGVGVVEGAVEEPSIAFRLLGAEQVLEAAVSLSDFVVGAKIGAES